MKLSAISIRPSADFKNDRLDPVIPSEDYMIPRLTTCNENALTPLGERVARDGAFTSRRGSGLRPPEGYGHSGRAGGYGPQAGEGVEVRYFHGSRSCPSADGYPETMKMREAPWSAAA